MPLVAFASASLRIHYNGCHPVPWDCPLGLSKCPQPIVALDLIEPDGGPVSRTMVCILRKYPLMYWCKLPGGTSVIQTPKAWDKACAAFQEERSVLEVKIQEDVMRRISRECAGKCGKIKQLGLDILARGGSYDVELMPAEQDELSRCVQTCYLLTWFTVFLFLLYRCFNGCTLQGYGGFEITGSAKVPRRTSTSNGRN